MTPVISNIQILISAAAFLAVFLLFLGIYQYIRQNARDRELIERVRNSNEKKMRLLIQKIYLWRHWARLRN